MSVSRKEEEKEEGALDKTEHVQLSRLIVGKMHAPQTRHDKQIHTNIPPNILTNILLLTAGENGLRELTRGDVTVYHADQKKVTIMRENDDGDLVPYRTISTKALRANQFWSDFWGGVSGNLMEELMSAKGWRSEQAVQEVSALTNSERQLMEAQNPKGPGYLKRLISAVKGGG